MTSHAASDRCSRNALFIPTSREKRTGFFVFGFPFPFSDFANLVRETCVFIDSMRSVLNIYCFDCFFLFLEFDWSYDSDRIGPLFANGGTSVRRECCRRCQSLGLGSGSIGTHAHRSSSRYQGARFPSLR